MLPPLKRCIAGFLMHLDYRPTLCNCMGHKDFRSLALALCFLHWKGVLGRWLKGTVITKFYFRLAPVDHFFFRILSSPAWKMIDSPLLGLPAWYSPRIYGHSYCSSLVASYIRYSWNCGDAFIPMGCRENIAKRMAAVEISPSAWR